MKKTVLNTLAALLISASGSAQAPIKPIYYAVSFPNAAHHEAEILITVPKAPDGVLRFRMSRSSAGRYATHEFGKNIYNIKAFNVDGTPLTVTQTEGDVYEVAADHADVVKLSYTLFANWTDGTYAGIDPSHAHLNMPATFLYLTGIDIDKRAIKFEFNDLEKYGWKVATQLKHEGANIYSAPNFQYMMDSPTELSAFKQTGWDVVNTDGKKQRINVTIHTDDDQPVIDNFGKMVQKVVLEQKAVFGELPTFDYGEYTFISDVYPTNSGDGMEHRNSTIIVDPVDKLAGNEIDILGTFSHEFFHSWNVKRIRPKSLEPFNFTHANMSNELWFAEGFTQYYGELMLARTGFHTLDRYQGTIAYLVNNVLNSAGAARYSATDASRKAVFVDAGVSIDPVNYANNFLSYYNYGGAIALALDLRLRSEFNLTLDDYMRAVWLANGKVMKPYTIKDLQNVLGKLTNPKFAAEFYDKYVYGIEKNNYAALLEKAGFILRKAAPGKGWSGLSPSPFRGSAGQAQTVGNTGVPINTSTVIGTPIYKAGIDAGDLILKADGKDVATAAAFNAIVSAKKPGDQVSIDYRNRTGAHTTTLIVEESPMFEVIVAEKTGKALTTEQTTFRNNWLSSKVNK
jgi:predicted metalloprotease with PDZ domain